MHMIDLVSTFKFQAKKEQYFLSHQSIQVTITYILDDNVDKNYLKLTEKKNSNL